MSDSFIFPDDPEGFGPIDGAPADRGPTPFAFESPAAPAAPSAPAGPSDDFAGFDGGFGPASSDFADFTDVAADPADGAPAGVAAPLAPSPESDGLDLSFAQAEDDAEEPAKAKAKKDRPSRAKKDGLILGVHVTPKQVYGVLVRPVGDGYEPLRQFVRNRAESQFANNALSPDDVDLDEGASIELGADDPAIQFGGAGEIDFSAEFAGMGVVTDAALDMTATAGVVEETAQPIIFELRDMLEECAQAGFARPALAFAVDAPDVAYAEIQVPPEKKKAKAKKAKAPKKPKKGEPDAPTQTDGLKESAAAPVKRDQLVGLIPDLGTTIDKDRAGFLEMTPRDGLRRYLAVAPTGSEPVAESLLMLREQSAHRKTQLKTLEAEVPLLVGLVGETSAPEPHENTAVVRVGAEDTIVLLLTGGLLHHFEPMPSVTAFDGPDTICSRVLLQQDVQGVGMVHNVVVVSEEREKELVQGFAAFYPEARVETLREGLARKGLVGPYGPLAPALIEAAGAAIAGHKARQKGSPFGDVNLLPGHLLKRKRRLDLTFAWHTLVVAMLLFLSVLYFSYLYVGQAGEIAAAERRLAEFPPEAQLSAPLLQARIDSLRTRQVALAAALSALDEILVDTDRWTQVVLRATRAAAETGGVWIEDWSPSGNDLTLEGYATARGNVVGLAQRLDATIESVSFQQLRDYPVYQYRMKFTQPPELPQVTRVLREQTGEATPAMAPAPLDGVARPAPASAGASGGPTP